MFIFQTYTSISIVLLIGTFWPIQTTYHFTNRKYRIFYEHHITLTNRKYGIFYEHHITFINRKYRIFYKQHTTFTNRKYRSFYKHTSYELTNFMLTFQNTCNLRNPVKIGSTRQDRVFRRKTTFVIFLKMFIMYFWTPTFQTIVISFLIKCIWVDCYVYSILLFGCDIDMKFRPRMFPPTDLGVWQIGIRAIDYSELVISLKITTIVSRLDKFSD